MNKTELDKTIKLIVDKTTTTVSQSEFPNYLFVANFGTKNNIAVPKNVGVDWLKIKQYIREKSISWSLNFTDDFIDQKIKELVSELKYGTSKLQNLGKTTNDWLDSLKKTPLEEHTFVIPIHYLNTKKELDFGTVKIVNLSKRVLDNIVPSSLRQNNVLYNNLVSELIKSNNTKVFAIVKTKCTDQTHGEKLSREYLERGLNAIRIFYDRHPVVQSEDFVAIKNHLFIHVTKNNFSEDYHNLNQKIPIILDSQIKSQFESLWKILRPFLFITVPSPLQSRLIVALDWYGDAMKDRTPHSSFFKYVTSIETLLILEKTGKAEKIAERLSKIMYPKSPANSYALMKSYYETRNGVIHAGRTIVHKEDLDQLHAWSQWLIQKFIHHSKKYADIPVLLKNEYGL